MIEQNTKDNVEKIISLVENMPTDTEIIVEKRTRGQRGPDKMPRKINLNSINNLRQYRINPELSSTIVRNISYSQSSKLLIGLAIFCLILLVGLLIWKITKIEL